MNEASHPPTFHADEEGSHDQKHFGAKATFVVLVLACIALSSMLVKRSASLAETRTQMDQANTALAQSKTDLESAKSVTAGLQTQLDASKAQINDVKSKLDAADSRNSSLQSRLTKVEGDQSGLKAQVSNANAQSTQLQDQLSKASDNAADLTKQLEQAKSQAAELQSRAAAAEAEVARLRPLAEKARALPVSAAFEKGFWGGGYVMKISNQSSGALKVDIAVSGSVKPPVSTTIDQGQTYEVKDLQQGANLVVSSDGYDKMYLTVK